MTTREASSIQEKDIAVVTGGKVVANSGGTKFDGGDVKVQSADMLIEAKTTLSAKTSFAIKKEWLEKAREQTFEQGCSRTALAFRFSPHDNMDYYVLPKREFLEYLSLIENS